MNFRAFCLKRRSGASSNITFPFPHFFRLV
nr:MAG TPA: hypothetical protein [Caudoviricetes sp.]